MKLQANRIPHKNQYPVEVQPHTGFGYHNNYIGIQPGRGLKHHSNDDKR